VNVFSSGPHGPSVLFVHDFVGQVEHTKRAENEQEPEGTILSEVHVAVVVHWVVRAGTLVVNDIWAHPVFKLNGILSIQERSVLMIIIQVVMNLGRVELASITKSLSSERARVLSRNTTLIVSKRVDTVLLTIFLQLVKSVLSIWPSNRLILGDHTSAISLISAVLHLILKFWHTLVQVRVLLAR